MTTIETIGEFDDGDTLRWSDFKRLARGRPLKQGSLAPWPDSGLPIEVLAERHHCGYGGPWILGRYAFEHLVNLGILPADKLLDVGCGTGRLGVHVVRFLEAGNYFGIEAHRNSLRIFYEYELMLHGLTDKRPRLLWDKEFSASYFGVEFDWIIDFATTLHVSEDQLPQAFGNLAKALAPSGRLLCANGSNFNPAAYGLRLEGETVQDCPLLRGYEDEFKSKIHWREFSRAHAWE